MMYWDKKIVEAAPRAHNRVKVIEHTELRVFGMAGRPLVAESLDTGLDNAQRMVRLEVQVDPQLLPYLRCYIAFTGNSPSAARRERSSLSEGVCDAQRTSPTAH